MVEDKAYRPNEIQSCKSEGRPLFQGGVAELSRSDQLSG